jgi:hypothetical protein
MATTVSASQGHQVSITLLKVKDTNIGQACHMEYCVVYSDKILSGFRLKDTNKWKLVCGEKHISFK